MLQDNGAPDAAFIWRKAADELEAWFNETISPVQAEAEGLGDAETVARKLREGVLENRGRRFKPMVRRVDLMVRTSRKDSDVPSIASLTRRALKARRTG